MIERVHIINSMLFYNAILSDIVLVPASRIARSAQFSDYFGVPSFQSSGSSANANAQSYEQNGGFPGFFGGNFGGSASEANANSQSYNVSLRLRLVHVISCNLRSCDL